MKTRLLLLSVMLLALSVSAFGQFIEIPISVKIIVAPNSGARPKNGTAEIKDELFYTAARRANEWMDSHSRGYRFKIAEIVNIGGPPQGLNGPSKWYNVNPLSAWATFQSDTKKDDYLLRADRVNFYVTQVVRFADRRPEEAGGRYLLQCDVLPQRDA